MKRITKLFVAISVVATFTNCCGKKGQETETTGNATETVDTTMAKTADSKDDATTVRQTLQASAFVGSWNEPDGDRHNLTLKEDKTFEYQDFETTKEGDVIDVMRQGTYAVDSEAIHLRGDDGWQLTLHYDATAKDGIHLTQGHLLDFVKE